VSALIFEDVSAIEEPELIVDVVSVVTVVVESAFALDSPEPPQAAKAPSTNTNNSFFIVSLFIVIVDLRVNTGIEER
jgi:hypothetical protein